MADKGHFGILLSADTISAKTKQPIFGQGQILFEHYFVMYTVKGTSVLGDHFCELGKNSGGAIYCFLT